MIPAATASLGPAAARERWDAAAPVHLRRALGTGLGESRSAVSRTVAMFERFRSGGLLDRELWGRCPEGGALEPAGVTVDLGDEREIEKVHVDLRRDGRIVARDLWAKLSWISTHPDDASLRIRFSFGAERHDDWRKDARRAQAADELSEIVFPECALLGRHRPLAELLRRWTGRATRLSERILFSNAPGGGAAFHHDAEEGQLGVAYAQLTGATAWLALGKRELAAEIAALAKGKLRTRAGTPARALRAMDGHDRDLDRLLNENDALTRRLVERGALHVMRAGDVLLLPSHGPDDAAWHSVFALGEKPSLALSFGVFPARGSGARG